MRPLMEKTPAGVWHNVVGQLDRKVDEASAGAWEAATRFSRGAGSRRSSRRQASSSRDLAQATQSPAQRDRLGDQRIVQATRTGPSATLCRYALARGADPLVDPEPLHLAHPGAVEALDGPARASARRRSSSARAIVLALRFSAYHAPILSPRAAAARWMACRALLESNNSPHSRLVTSRSTANCDVARLHGRGSRRKDSGQSRSRSARCAGPLHEIAAVHLLRDVLIVAAAEQPDAVDFVEMRSRKAVQVIEFEPAGLRASSAVLVGESAATTVPLEHRSFDGIRNVTRTR